MTFLGLSKTFAARKQRDSDARGSGEIWTLRQSWIAWTALAVFAALYLVSLVAFDGLTTVASRAPKSVSDRYASVQTPRPHAGSMKPKDTSAENAELRAGLTRLIAEVRRLRSSINELRRRGDTLESRLASLEGAVGPTTSALPAARAASEMASLRPRRKVPSVSVALRPMPEDGFGDQSASTSPLPVAGVSSPTRTLFGAELARAATPEALRTRWQSLRSRHEEILDKLEARRDTDWRGADARRSGGQRLLVGPFENAADAARLCARLRAKKARCRETVFSGKSL